MAADYPAAAAVSRPRPGTFTEGGLLPPGPARAPGHWQCQGDSAPPAAAVTVAVGRPVTGRTGRPAPGASTTVGRRDTIHRDWPRFLLETRQKTMSRSREGRGRSAAQFPARRPAARRRSAMMVPAQ